MSNAHGTWRCVCEQDTMRIHVIEASKLVLEFATGILHLLPRVVPADMDAFELKPTELSGVDIVDEQYAWYVEVCV